MRSEFGFKGRGGGTLMKKMMVGLIGLACVALFMAGCTEPIDDSCGTCSFGKCVNGTCVCDVGYGLDDDGHCTVCAIGYAPDPVHGLCVKYRETARQIVAPEAVRAMPVFAMWDTPSMVLAPARCVRPAM